MENEKEKPEMMTTKEVTEMLRITRTTLYKWMDKGKLTPVRPGKKLLFARQDVEALLKPPQS